MINGFLFGVGFFFAMVLCLIFLCIAISAIAKQKKKPKFSIAAFQKYARHLRDTEQYVELEKVRKILEFLHKGKEPDAKLTEAYDVKVESKLKVKGSSISVQKIESIIKKPGSDSAK